jgi:sporulation integral membrane protein YtvI
LFCVIWVLPQIWDKLSPFIVALPVAAVLQPVIRFLQGKMKMKRGPASLIPVILLLLVALGILTWLFTVGVTQVSRIVNHSGDLVTDSINSVRQAMNNLMATIGANTDIAVEQWVRSAINNMVEHLSMWGTSAAEMLVTFSISLAASMPYCIIYISFLAIGLYFITKDYDNIRSYLPGGKRRKQDSRTTQLTNSTVKSLFGYLRVQGTFGLIVWVISWIYLACFGFNYSGLFALCAGVMELIPMIGSGVPYFVLCAIHFLLGNNSQALQILLLTLGLQVLRRVLEPKLMSDNIGITPLQSVVGMFVGMRFGGIVGLIGGPVLMSVLVGAIKGGAFRNILRDFHIVSSYLKNRWRMDE